MALILSILARWGVPESLRKAVAWLAIIIALAVLLGIAKCSYDRSIIDAHEAETAAKVEHKAREGDQAARGAADEIRTETEKSNDDARNAAAGSDDPLRDGLNSLRR